MVTCPITHATTTRDRSGWIRGSGGQDQRGQEQRQQQQIEEKSLSTSSLNDKLAAAGNSKPTQGNAANRATKSTA